MNAHDPARCLRYGKPGWQRLSMPPQPVRRQPLARCIRRAWGGAR